MLWLEIGHNRLKVTEKSTDELNENGLCFWFILNCQQAMISLFQQLVGEVSHENLFILF